MRGFKEKKEQQREKEGKRMKQAEPMFGLWLMEAPDKHGGPPASKHAPDSSCSRETSAAYLATQFLHLPALFILNNSAEAAAQTSRTKSVFSSS